MTIRLELWLIFFTPMEHTKDSVAMDYTREDPVFFLSRNFAIMKNESLFKAISHVRKHISIMPDIFRVITS